MSTTVEVVGVHDERATYTVEEAARLLGVSRGSAYEAVRRGTIPALRILNRWVIPRPALEGLLNSVDSGAGTPERNPRAA